MTREVFHPPLFSTPPWRPPTNPPDSCSALRGMPPCQPSLSAGSPSIDLQGAAEQLQAAAHSNAALIAALGVPASLINNKRLGVLTAWRKRKRAKKADFGQFLEGRADTP